MPLIRFYKNAITMSRPNMFPRRFPERTIIRGWTMGAAARNMRFLWAIDADRLDGNGAALSLTVRDLPPRREDWTELVTRWIDRQRHKSLIRLHWVCEWQERGAPHLHVSPYYRNVEDCNLGGWGQQPIDDWVELGDRYGARPWSQRGREITGPVGWFRYVARHASRGIEHYQRQVGKLPATWTGSGRLWGKQGSWPRELPIDVDVSEREGEEMRGLVAVWLLREARSWHTSSSNRCLRIGPDPKDAARAWGWGRTKAEGEVLKAMCYIPQGTALKLLEIVKRDST